MTIRLLILGTISLLTFAASCSNFSAAEDNSASSSTTTTATGSGGSGGTGGTANSGGGNSCGATFNYPESFGGAECQSCMAATGCTQLMNCDKHGCDSLLTGCYQKDCGGYHDLPCIENCLMQYEEATVSAFNAVWTLLESCPSCGFTSESLCGTAIPAVTSKCQQEAETQCCEAVFACEADANCNKCAQGVNTGMCDVNANFATLIACLGTKTGGKCSY